MRNATTGQFISKNLIGQRFGGLVVLEKDEEKTAKSKNTYWKCRCDCGNAVVKRVDQLTSGKSISCGCQKKALYKDLAGQRFGRLVVLQPTEERASNGSVKWLCSCDCGNTTVVKTTNLRSGNTQSCGCLAKEVRVERLKANRKDLTGLVFEKLTVIEDTGKVDNQRRHFWLCQCECGNLIEVRDNSLTSGNTKSCGCHYSKGEAIIQNILQENNIKYEKEKTFEDLKGQKGWALRYDFYLPDYNRLIEYDGEQHFGFTGNGWDTEENYQKVQQSDNLKNAYAKEHDIALVRIPYTEKSNITLDSLLNDDFLTKL